MATYIYPLDQFGIQFMNDVIQYCQLTGQPNTPEIRKNIFNEVISQVLLYMDPDYQQFMLNLMMLPDWRTINYTGEDVNYENVGLFRDQIRAFAILIWQTILSKTGIEANRYYFLEGCDTTFIVVQVCVNAELL